MRPSRLALSASAALLAAGCGATSAAPAVPAHRRAATYAGSAPTIDSLAATAQARYDEEVRGGPVHRQLSRVNSDPSLLRALETSNRAALRAAALRLQKQPGHVSRLRVLRGNRPLVDVGVPFCVAGSRSTLRAPDGTVLGTLEISIQDEIGFVRYMHRNYPVDVVVRGPGGLTRSSLPAATQARLPRSGAVTLAGRRYQVRAFDRRALDDQPVTAWILTRA